MEGGSSSSSSSGSEKGEREPVPDAPAVYFVRPSRENIDRIVRDCSRQMYRKAFVNFVTTIERPLLEHFAKSLCDAQAQAVVSKVMSFSQPAS